MGRAHLAAGVLALGARASAAPVATAPEPIDGRPRVEDVRAIPPGGDAPMPAKRGAFALGARFPHCQAQGMAGEFVASTPGVARLVCGATPLSVVIAPIVVAGPEAPVARGRTTLVHVDVASVGELGEHLDITVTGDATAGAARRTEYGFDVPVTVAPGAHQVVIAVAARDQTLGTVSLELADGPPIEPLELPASTWFALDLGGMLGAIALPSSGGGSTRIGRPTDPSDAVTGGPLFGPRVGLFPTTRVGVEGELALAIGSRQVGFDAAPLLLSRLQLAVRAYDRGRAGLRVIAGAGMIRSLADRGTSMASTSGEVHGGVAVTFETRRDLWLRLQVSDVVTTARDASFSHCFEVALGIQTRIGRRDRW